jgi:hypothetical protein
MRCRALLLRFTDSIGIKSQAQLAAADPIRHQRRDGEARRDVMGWDVFISQQDRNYERSRGIWTNLFGGSKKNSEENSEK